MKPSLLTRLTNQPDALNHLLAGLTDDQMHQRPPTGKWSISENLAHLGRYQAVFLNRLQRIIAEEMPLFGRYAADNDPGFTDWSRLSFPTLVERMRDERSTLNAFLTSLHEEQLTRIGRHSVYGPMTIEGWTEFFLLHEAHHFFTILRLGGSLRTGGQPMGAYPRP